MGRSRAAASIRLVTESNSRKRASSLSVPLAGSMSSFSRDLGDQLGDLGCARASCQPSATGSASRA